MFRWRKVAIVLRREYLSRVKTKAFWISTLLLPVFLAAFTILPSLLMRRAGGRAQIAVVTADRPLFDEVQRVLEVQEDSGGPASATRLEVKLTYHAPAADEAAQRHELKRDLVAKRLQGAVILPADVLRDGEVAYLSTNVSAFRLMSALDRAVEAAVIHRRLIEAGLDPSRVGALSKRTSFKPVRIADDLSEAKDSVERSFFASYLLTFTIYMTMIFYGYYVLRGVLEEKSSRIVEVIVANVRPIELMLGKIFGIGAVGLTQYLIWAIVAMNLAVPGLLGAATGGFDAFFSPTVVIFFVVFFLCGYFQFSSLYAAIGSAFNAEEEAQQMQSLVGMFMAVPIVLMFPVMANPDATWAVALSLLPFFAPMLFFVRMTIQMPPVWQIALCVAIQIVAIFVVAKIAAAIYRVGILMYGKKPTFREIWTWVRAS